MTDYFEEPSWLPAAEEYPVFELELEEVAYTFKWENTLIRRYGVASGQFDHILHLPDEGDAVAIFLTHPDVTDALNYLESNRYPSRMDPLPDANVLDLFATIQGRKIGDFIE